MYLRRPTRVTGIVLVAVLILGGCGRIPEGDPLASGATEEPAAGATSPSASPVAGEECEYVPTGSPARPVRPPSPTGVPDSGTVRYALTMTEGTVTITLDRVRAPCTVHSFESLATQKFFDGTRCHRLLDFGAFLLHCGDPTGTGDGGPGYTFADETDGTESYTARVVAMANGGPNTNGSQFFLVYDDSTSLDANPQYTIFGTVDETSRGIVARMATEGQDGTNPDGSGRPNNPAEIIKITRIG